MQTQLLKRNWVKTLGRVRIMYCRFLFSIFFIFAAHSLEAPSSTPIGEDQVSAIVVVVIVLAVICLGLIAAVAVLLYQKKQYTVHRTSIGRTYSKQSPQCGLLFTSRLVRHVNCVY